MIKVFGPTETLTDLENKDMVAREKGGGGMVGEFGMDMYTLLYIKWITQEGSTVYHRNSAVCYIA